MKELDNFEYRKEDHVKPQDIGKDKNLQEGAKHQESSKDRNLLEAATL